MPVFNPYAIYVRCDGSMIYDSRNSAGIGYVIEFPDRYNIQPIEVSEGIYTDANIERVEILSIIEAMEATIDQINFHPQLKGSPIRVITDRNALRDDSRTNPYVISQWRKQGWKTHDGKPIKNKDLIDKLDKTRLKLNKTAQARVNIEWRRRKENKKADKLSKKGRKEGLPNKKIAKVGMKIGRRKFDGREISYTQLTSKQHLHINIFGKDPVQDEYEIWAEVCSEEKIGQKIKIYADDIISSRLNRGNQFVIRIKSVHKHYIRIYKTINKKKMLKLDTPKK